MCIEYFTNKEYSYLISILLCVFVLSFLMIVIFLLNKKEIRVGTSFVVLGAFIIGMFSMEDNVSMLTLNKHTKSSEDSVLMYQSRGEEYVKILAKKPGLLELKSRNKQTYKYHLKENEMMKLKVLYEDENKDEIVLMSSEGEIIPFSKEKLINFMFENE